jgi:hypothetical protein
MAKLFWLSTRLTLEGFAAPKSYGNRILYEARDAHSVAERDALNTAVANKILGILSEGVGIYTVTNTPAIAPGTVTKDRTKHKTTYIEEKGLLELPAGKSIAQLDICADFFKESSEGNGGNIFIRGVMNEDEYDTDAEGNLVKPIGAALARFDTFASELKALFEAQGGRGMVLPGRTKNDDETFLTLAEWTAAARNVDDLFFEGLVKRQVSKKNNTEDADELDLIRRKVKRLYKEYREIKTNSPGGVISAVEEESLYDLGEEIFRKSDPSERSRARPHKDIKKYIRETPKVGV